MCCKCGPQTSLVTLCLWGLRDERYQNHSSLAPLKDKLTVLAKIRVVIVRMREIPSSELGTFSIIAEEKKERNYCCMVAGRSGAFTYVI